jgi:hypothetical protein
VAAEVAAGVAVHEEEWVAAAHSEAAVHVADPAEVQAVWAAVAAPAVLDSEELAVALRAAADSAEGCLPQERGAGPGRPVASGAVVIHLPVAVLVLWRAGPREQAGAAPRAHWAAVIRSAGPVQAPWLRAERAEQAERLACAAERVVLGALAAQVRSVELELPRVSLAVTERRPRRA